MSLGHETLKRFKSLDLDPDRLVGVAELLYQSLVELLSKDEVLIPPLFLRAVLVLLTLDQCFDTILQHCEGVWVCLSQCSQLFDRPVCVPELSSDINFPLQVQKLSMRLRHARCLVKKSVNLEDTLGGENFQVESL